MHVNIKPAYIFSTLLSILLFTASTSYSQDYTIVKLFEREDCVINSVQMNNNGYVVWEADVGNGLDNQEIFLYDGSEVKQLTNNSENEFSPSINDNGYVVWHGYSALEGGNSRIFLYDGSAVTPLTDGSMSCWFPQINNNNEVVWYGKDDSDYDNEIFLYDGSDVIQLTDNSHVDERPRINDIGYVVWQELDDDLDYEIFLYDGTNTIQLTGNYWDDKYPQINNSGEVVWIEDDGSEEILLYDGSAVTTLTSDGNYKESPSINDNGYAVWELNDAVFLYDGLVSTNLSNLSSYSGYSDVVDPQINNSGYVVWEGGEGIIFLYDGLEVTQLTYDVHSGYEPQINDSGHVSWYTTREIFYAYPSGDDGPDGIVEEIGDDDGDDDGGDVVDGIYQGTTGVFGAISINDVIGYHLDGITKNGTKIYMPVTKGFKALKGALTHIEAHAPDFANMIRGGFDSLERKAEANKDGVLYRVGTHLFPSLGKIAEIYLDAVNSEDLMTNAYSDTMISATEFNKQRRKGIAACTHVVKGNN